MITPKFCYELEQHVLENLMSFNGSMDKRLQSAMLKLSPNRFYSPVNAKIFDLIREAFDRQDPITFVDILVKVGQGNHDLHQAIAKIMENYRLYHYSNNSLEVDIEKLVTLSNLRRQLRRIDDLIDAVAECSDPLEAQTILADGLNETATMNHRESKHGISNMEIAEQFYDGKWVKPNPIPTTCDELNQATGGGIMPKSLMIVAAGAGVGKTGFAIYLTDIIARTQSDHEALFFSLEMEYSQIWMRHIGICAGKQFDKLTDDERMTAVTKSSQVPMKIYDAAICRQVADIDFILTTARLRAMQKPISVIVVDYLGLVQSKSSFERNDLKQSDITSKLAELAIQLNCTVIALSQINRGAANRGIEDRCPWPHDAADSSGGHRSSSLWLGVDRPELYQDDPCYRNQFVIKCRKNRFGGIFELTLAFNDGTFAEVEPGFFQKANKSSQSHEQALFSPHCKDFYAPE